MPTALAKNQSLDRYLRLRDFARHTEMTGIYGRSWRNGLDTKKIVQELESERDRLERAIAALKGLHGAPPRTANSAGRRPLSAAARRRIAQAQKKRWAAFRKKQ